MIAGYIFSRKDNKEFSILVGDSPETTKRKQQCEDCFYDYIRESLLARMLSIEDKPFL